EQQDMTNAAYYPEDHPKYYYTEDVPWGQYFHRGYAFHGAPWRSSFGYSGSHGCVNMPVSDATWLYHWASIGTRLVVHDGAAIAPVAAARAERAPLPTAVETGPLDVRGAIPQQRASTGTTSRGRQEAPSRATIAISRPAASSAATGRSPAEAACSGSGAGTAGAPSSERLRRPFPSAADCPSSTSRVGSARAAVVPRPGSGSSTASP